MSNFPGEQDQAMNEILDVMTSRRDAVKLLGKTAVAGAFLGMAGFNPAMAQELTRASRPLRVAMGNAGLQTSWCAQGKQAAEAWARLMNVELVWFDGELSVTKQRAVVDNLAAQRWDFVALQAFGIGTLTDPVRRIIDSGTPVIAMDVMIAPEGQLAVHTLISADQVYMGRVVAEQIMQAIGGRGNVVMTQGPLSHTGAQGRARGFREVLAKYPNVTLVDDQPADWNLPQVARIWESLLTKYPNIAGAFFHSDDMALAAYNVMRAKGRTGIAIGGVDAVPFSINAILDGRMVATVRNPAGRVHGWAIAAGVAAVIAGERTGREIPNYIWADGPLVTRETAASQLWLQKHFLM